MYFNGTQASRINDLIEKIEERTGIELVAAVVGKCDSYPEIPWKAFALAASASSLAVLVQAFIGHGCALLRNPQFAAAFILGAGAISALLAVFMPAFGRLFLDRVRAETETEQYARAFFLERELFRTAGRTGILVMVGLFERTVVILPDSGVHGRLEQGKLHGVIAAMTPHLRRKDRCEAFMQGLAALEEELLQAGFRNTKKTDNEIADGLIQEKGEDR
ncbi:MAG TPA: hypothetical protein PLM53_11245 [Spirochaetota bacterium]|nr:hypothetical protein [Spirochaetota bacterium]HPC41524.1 hypothetical protein [Spirochaetota bacterium]HPL15589.1 hypothetical protein [Spirochaetota bacterium]HQF09108.1 hypothetical protein [Spirochaetota bacterium]HQH97667.1 hypothetical protein [Spirochaetota bacterium]